MNQVYYDCYGNQISEEKVFEVFKEDKMPTNSKNFSFTAMVNVPIAPTVKEVIFAPPATIVYWQDGSRTVVKCDENDEFNEEVGFTLCFVKKMLGNGGSYNTYIRKQIKDAKRYYSEVDLEWKKGL